MGVIWEVKYPVCRGQITLHMGTHKFSVKHALQDCTDGPGKLGVSQPKPFVYTPPAEIRLLLTKREWWICNNHGVTLTPIIHWLRPPLFLPWCFRATLAIWSERFARDPNQKNTTPTVRLEPAIYRLQVLAVY